MLKEVNNNHPQFKRKGDDLLMEKTITLQEALCGFKFHFKHMDGRDVVVQSQEGEVIAPDSFRVVSGEGMPFRRDPQSRGRLIIRFTVQFPEPHLITEASRKELLKLLPGPKVCSFSPCYVCHHNSSKDQVKAGDWPDAERHVAMDFTPSREEQKAAYEEDDESDQRPRQAQCQSQ